MLLIISIILLFIALFTNDPEWARTCMYTAGLFGIGYGLEVHNKNN